MQFGGPQEIYCLLSLSSGKLRHFILLLLPVTGREELRQKNVIIGKHIYEPMKAEEETVSGGMCLFGLKVMKTGQLCVRVAG